MVFFFCLQHKSFFRPNFYVSLSFLKCFSVIDFQLNSILVEEHTLYDFNLFIFFMLVLWFNIWSILETVSFTLEKNVYSTFVWGNVL